MLQINTGNLHRVLKDFYILTGIRIVVFDGDFQEILAYPPQLMGFCGTLRQDPRQDAKCRSSDRSGCVRCASTQGVTFYRCHAGLTEVVMPLQDNSGTIGYVMFGQVIPEENRTQVLQHLMAQFPSHKHLINDISVKSEESLNAAATVLQALTAYVLSNHWVTPGKSQFIRQLDAYILANIQHSITSEALCAHFHMGRTRLYEVSKAYLGCGLAEYIRSQRILQAQQLLRHTELSVGDVAYAVGFTDYNHFSRVFKALCGISAREYRKQK